MTAQAMSFLLAIWHSDSFRKMTDCRSEKTLAKGPMIRFINVFSSENMVVEYKGLLPYVLLYR